MKVYQLNHTMFGGWQRDTCVERLGTYASEALALEELDKLRKQMVATDHLRIQEHPYGRGFSYGSTWGSMTFVPGQYTLTEIEIVE